MLVVEYVVDGEVVVLKILTSYLGNSWSLDTVLGSVRQFPLRRRT